MKILSTGKIPFTALKIRQDKDIKVPEDFQCTDREGDNCTVSYADSGRKSFRIDGTSGGYMLFHTGDNTLYGDYIKVPEPMQRRGLGTVLHLTKIIEMMENDFSTIKIQSMNTAVLFHAKFGFRPDIKDFKEAQNALIAVSRTGFLSEDLIDVASQAYEQTPFADEKEYIERANKIFDKFLKICSASKEIDPDDIYFPDDPFDQNFMYNMKLTRQDVINNKDFYNNLFKKYKIDYQIS